MAPKNFFEKLFFEVCGEVVMKIFFNFITFLRMQNAFIWLNNEQKKMNSRGENSISFLPCQSGVKNFD